MRVSTHFGRVLPIALLLGLGGTLLQPLPAGALDSPTINSVTGGPAADAMTLSWTSVAGAVSYAYDYSTNSGVSYSTAKISLGATSPKTIPVRVGCRFNDAANGAACRFRVYAKDAFGYSAPSAAAGPITWGVAAPSAPRTMKAIATTSAYTTVKTTWLAPADTGGLPVITYRVEVSNDGGAYTTVPWSPITTRTYTETAGTCSGNATCAYRSFATTANGEGSASNVSTITVTPSAVPAIKFDHAGELEPDPGAGTAGELPIRLTWGAPAKGVTSGYEWASQQLTSTTAGVRTLGALSSSTDLGTATEVSPTCAAGSTSCYIHVRAYNNRAGAPTAYGSWKAVNYQPWAPYSLGGGVGRDLTFARTYGATKAIGVDVSGPVEGGPGPKTSAVKTYVVQACDEVSMSGCTLNSDWTTVSSGVLAYPTVRIAAIDVSTPCSDDAHACALRVRLVDAVATASGAFKVGTYKGIWSVKETAAGQ